MNDRNESARLVADARTTISWSIILLIVAAVTGIFVARFLGPSDFGDFRLILSVFALVTLAVNMGIDAAVIKFVSADSANPSVAKLYLGIGTVFSIVLGLVGIAAVALLLLLLSELSAMHEFDILLFILATSMPSILFVQVVQGYYNGLRRMKSYVAVSILLASVQFALYSVALLLGFGLKGVIVGTAASYGMVALVLLVAARLPIGMAHGLTAKESKTFIKFGIQNNAGNVVNWITYQLDLVLIGILLTSSHVGYYAIAVTVSRYIWIFPQSLQRITFPASSEYYSNNRPDSLRKMNETVLSLTVTFLLASAIALWAFGTSLISTLYGAEFQLAVNALVVLMPGTVLFGSYLAIAGTLPASNRPDLNSKIALVGAILAIMLDLTLIPSMGLLGAAIAASTSLSSMAIIGFVLIRRYSRFTIDNGWLMRLCATSVLAILSIGVVSQFHLGDYVSATILVLYYASVWSYVLDARKRGEVTTFFLPKKGG